MIGLSMNQRSQEYRAIRLRLKKQFFMKGIVVSNENLKNLKELVNCFLERWNTSCQTLLKRKHESGDVKRNYRESNLERLAGILEVLRNGTCVVAWLPENVRPGIIRGWQGVA